MGLSKGLNMDERRPHLRRQLLEEDLIDGLVKLVDQGDQVVIDRIFESLQIDGEAKPTRDQVRAHVKKLIEEKAKGGRE